MSDARLLLTRRSFLRRFALGAAALWTPGVFAEILTPGRRAPTPRQTEGPFYPESWTDGAVR